MDEWCHGVAVCFYDYTYIDFMSNVMKYSVFLFLFFFFFFSFKITFT